MFSPHFYLVEFVVYIMLGLNFIMSMVARISYQLDRFLVYKMPTECYVFSLSLLSCVCCFIIFWAVFLACKMVC